MVTIYGIKNCATMKKTFDWCASHSIQYDFHDYKKRGITQDLLLQWCRALGWKTLLNTRGTTWRKLTPAQQSLTSEPQAIALMGEYPSLIKRPVINTGTQLLIGYDPQLFASFLR